MRPHVAGVDESAGGMEWDALGGLFPEFDGAGRWLRLLRRHAALIAEAAPRVRVTAVPPGQMVRRQYAESLEMLRIALPYAPAGPIADVGSGGGFPGIVFAAVQGDRAVHLIEPLKKRAQLLAEMAQVLGLSNVSVHAVRAEDAGRGPLRDGCALVTARAVAELRELLEYTAPLAAAGGVVALAKGSGLGAELAAAETAQATLACTFLRGEPMRGEVSETVSVALFAKTGPTPAGYPRRAGVPGKRPL